MRALLIALCLAWTATAGLKHNFDRPVFVYAHHPDLPLERYFAGELGIPDPAHARIYLYAAYRYLNGRPLAPDEQKNLLALQEYRLNGFWSKPEEGGLAAWAKIRRTVKDPPYQPLSEPRRMAQREFTTAVSSSHAFYTAADTLRRRIGQFGTRSAEVRFWVQGQDAVFQGQAPPAAPLGMHPLLRADRDYQIAAAYFHLGDDNAAIPRFQRIAADPQSPWQVWAPYLIGRCLLHTARVLEGTRYLPAVEAAQRQFAAVLADPKLRVAHNDAERLYLRCLLVTNNRAGLERIGRRLARSCRNYFDLELYLGNLDTLLDGTYHTFRGVYERPAPPSWTEQPKDDLSQWLLMFQNGQAWTQRAAWRRWVESKSSAWLYAAIVNAKTDPSGELRRAATATPLAHPAGAALHYHAARLDALAGDNEAARRRLAPVLAKLDGLPSARNHSLTLAMQLAPSLEEFLKLTARTVILPSSETDIAEFESEAIYQEPNLDAYAGDKEQIRRDIWQAAENAGKLAALPRLDAATETILSHRLPLDLLHQISTGNALPPHLLLETQLVTFTRAVLLNRFDTATSLVPALANAYPAAKADLDRFREKPSELTAAYVFLRLPGARPYFSRGYGRDLSADKHDEWSRNWWYRFIEAEMYGDLPYRRPETVQLIPQLAFLSAGQQQQAAREWDQFRKTGERGLHWLSSRIANDIQRNPKQAGANEILRRLIDADRRIWWAGRPDDGLPIPGIDYARRVLNEQRPPWDLNPQ